MRTREAIKVIKANIATWLADPKNDIPGVVLHIAKKKHGGVAVGWARITSPHGYGEIVK